MRQSRNAEEALLAALNACARRTRTISRIKQPDQEAGSVAFGTWLRRIQGQWKGTASLVVLCLSYLDLVQTHLVMSDFTEADMSHSDLSRANLYSSRCARARFDHAILHGATLANCELRWANFDGAVLRDVNLKEANLTFAHLYGIDADAEARKALGLVDEPPASADEAPTS